MSMEQRLQDLETRAEKVADVKAVAGLMARYAYCADRGWDRYRYPDEDIRLFFTPDCEWNGGAFGVAKGHAELRELFKNFAKTIPFAFHIATNPLIEVKGSTANGEWHLVLMMNGPDADGKAAQIIGTGIYKVSFVKAHGTWRIKTMRITPVFAEPFQKAWGEAKGLAR